MITGMLLEYVSLLLSPLHAIDQSSHMHKVASLTSECTLSYVFLLLLPQVVFCHARKITCTQQIAFPWVFQCTLTGMDRAMRDAAKSPAYQRALANSVKSFGAKSAGVKSVGGKSVGGKSVGGRSMGGKSAGGQSAGGRSAGGVSKKGPSLHSGDRFVAGLRFGTLTQI